MIVNNSASYQFGNVHIICLAPFHIWGRYVSVLVYTLFGPSSKNNQNDSYPFSPSTSILWNDVCTVRLYFLMDDDFSGWLNVFSSEYSSAARRAGLVNVFGGARTDDKTSVRTLMLRIFRLDHAVSISPCQRTC